MSQKTWDINVGGRVFAVNAVEVEGGKWVVRVDGRVAAQPLGPDETERLIRIGGAIYRFYRDEKNDPVLDLHQAVPATTSNHPAAVIPDRLDELPLGFVPSNVYRIPKRLWIVVAVILALMMWYALGPSYEKQAVGRVNAIVADMALGTGPEVQFAVGLWARNVRTLADRDELSWASDHFDQWRREKNLYHRFSSWKVVESSIVKDAEIPTALVTVEIEGTTYKMLVPERRPISWAN